MAVHTAAHHSSGQVLPFRESLMAMLSVSLVTMLVALDQTVVGTALPTIVTELKGFDLYAWVATSYLLTSVITVPIFGRLGDYYGRKPFVIASIIVFTVASVLCGLANSMMFLVLARSLQGIGGGMLVGTAFACIADLFPDNIVRLRWQVLMSSAFGIANAVGPSFGGFLTQYYGWRLVFYVNLPVGVVSLFFVWRFLPHLRHVAHERKMRLDFPGAILIAIVLDALQLFVEMLPKHGLSVETAVLLGLSVAASFALWKWEKRCDYAILPIDMFRNKALAALFTLSVLGGFAMFSLLFYAPLLFQGGFGMDPKDAGMMIMPLVVFITFGSILNGRIVTRLKNANLMLFIGFACIAVSCLGVVVATRNMPREILLVVMLIGGLGLGFVMPNLTVFAQQMAGRAHLGIATALLQSLRMIGGMIGTALTGTLVGHLYASGVSLALEKDHAMKWLADLSDPQILINRDGQRALLAQLASAGHDGAALLESARESLVAAIHIGLSVAALVALVSFWQTRRVLPVRLKGPQEPVILAE
ncbi:Permease of the major facilitator superfamily [Candidatus Paraburkholderia calva]|nr:Permease of the major facilitator superfamily [Candidatus Paraburkholderia calva]